MFGFSGRDLDVSPRYIAVVCDIAQHTSLLYCILSNTTVSHFVYTGTRVQFSRWNIICNLHRYYNLYVALSEQNDVGILIPKKKMVGQADRWIDGEECKSLLVTSESFRVFLDSGLLEDVTSEKLWYVHSKIIFRRDDVEIDCKVLYNQRRVRRPRNHNVPFQLTGLTAFAMSHLCPLGLSRT